MTKGKFITIYGINNIGKSTHAKLLVDHLKKAGLKACYVKYPIYDILPSGPFINNILRNENKQNISEEELQMWFVINRYQFQPKLEKFLNDGYIVIAEDYTGTGIAWGSAKGVSTDWLKIINSKVIKEDLAIMLHGERDKRAKEKKHIHEQNEELVKKCISVHEDLAKKYGWIKVKLQNDIKDTAKIIWDIVDEFL